MAGLEVKEGRQLRFKAVPDEMQFYHSIPENYADGDKRPIVKGRAKDDLSVTEKEASRLVTTFPGNFKVVD